MWKKVKVMLTVGRWLFQSLHRPISLYQNLPRRIHVDIKETLKSSLNNYTDLKLIPLRISNCNLGRSFSKTFLDYEELSNPDDGALYHVEFSRLFRRGFDCLNNYLDRNVGFFDTFRLNGVPDNERDHFRALTALRMFLEKLGMWKVVLWLDINTPAQTQLQYFFYYPKYFVLIHFS